MFSKIVNAVSSAFDVNHSTLSGAIDIICIEDGDQMVSTPFHVRFGKLQVLHTNEKMVSITVNGQTSDVSMKLGKAGEAYFFDQTTGVSDEHFLQSRSLSSSLAGSPVNGSIMSPPLGALDSAFSLDASEKGKSMPSLPSSPRPSTDVSQAASVASMQLASPTRARSATLTTTSDPPQASSPAHLQPSMRSAAANLPFDATQSLVRTISSTADLPSSLHFSGFCNGSSSSNSSNSSTSINGGSIGDSFSSYSSTASLDALQTVGAAPLSSSPTASVVWWTDGWAAESQSTAGAENSGRIGGGGGLRRTTLRSTNSYHNLSAAEEAALLRAGGTFADAPSDNLTFAANAEALVSAPAAINIAGQEQGDEYLAMPQTSSQDAVESFSIDTAALSSSPSSSSVSTSADASSATVDKPSSSDRPGFLGGLKKSLLGMFGRNNSSKSMLKSDDKKYESDGSTGKSTQSVPSSPHISGIGSGASSASSSVLNSPVKKPLLAPATSRPLSSLAAADGSMARSGDSAPSAIDSASSPLSASMSATAAGTALASDSLSLSTDAMSVTAISASTVAPAVAVSAMPPASAFPTVWGSSLSSFEMLAEMGRSNRSSNYSSSGDNYSRGSNYSNGTSYSNNFSSRGAGNSTGTHIGSHEFASMPPATLPPVAAPTSSAAPLSVSSPRGSVATHTYSSVDNRSSLTVSDALLSIQNSSMGGGGGAPSSTASSSYSAQSSRSSSAMNSPVFRSKPSASQLGGGPGLRVMSPLSAAPIHTDGSDSAPYGSGPSSPSNGNAPWSGANTAGADSRLATFSPSSSSVNAAQSNGSSASFNCDALAALARMRSITSPTSSNSFLTSPPLRPTSALSSAESSAASATAFGGNFPAASTSFAIVSPHPERLLQQQQDHVTLAYAEAMPAPLSPPASFADLMSPEQPQLCTDASMGSNVWGSDSVSSLAESDRSDTTNAEAALSASSSHAIELSLCGAHMNHANGSAADLAAAFAAHRVSWQSLSARPDLVFAPELVVRFGRQLFPGKVALPLLFSYLAFGVPLSDEALRALAASTQAQPLAPSSASASTQSAASETSVSQTAAVSSAAASAPSSALAAEAAAAVPQESRGFMSWLRGSRKNKQTLDAADATGSSSSNGSNASLSASSSVSSLASNSAPLTLAPLSSSSIPSSGSASPALVASSASAAGKAGASRTATAAVFSPLVELALEDDVAAATNGGDAPIAADNAANADESESESGGLRGNGRDAADPASSSTTAATLAAVSAAATAAAQPFRSLRPSSSVLRSFGLRPGMNSVTFAVSSRLQGVQTVEAHIFLWRADAKVVISDIDGTITKSDFLGNVMPLVGRDWSHEGVAGLFASIASNGYQFMYLTSRAIGQAHITRSYIRSLRQGEHALPDGPVIMCPDSLIHAFKREVIDRRPHEFKIAALTGYTLNHALLDLYAYSYQNALEYLVRDVFRAEHQPFYAGFGNRDTDLLSYRAVGVHPSKVFIIDPSGAIAQANRHLRTSYPQLTDLVASMFPPHDAQPRAAAQETAFADLGFWRAPIRAPTAGDVSAWF